MKSSIIRRNVQDGDKKLFASRALTLKLLMDCPQTIPVLAQWIYDEWHPYDKTLTKDKLVTSFGKRLNDSEIPFTIVVLKEQIPVGMISLKANGEPEFNDVGVGSPWIGSFHLIPEERNKKIGTDLLLILKVIAKDLGYQKIFVYTSNPKNIDWYAQRGAKVLEERPFRGHAATLMELKAE